MAINIQRREFIAFILDEILSYMNLGIYVANDDKATLIYRDDGTTTVVRNTTFEEVLEFCGLGDLKDKYSSMNMDSLYKKLTESKYFNFNMFDMDSNKRLFKDAKEYSLSSMFRNFIAYLISNRDSLKDNNYEFTTHKRLYVKAIDLFFSTDIEKILDASYNSLKETILDPERVKEYIKEKRGENSVIPEGSIAECIEELIESVEHSEGGLKKYLREASIETIKKDVQVIYEHYVLRDYNLAS